MKGVSFAKILPPDAIPVPGLKYISTRSLRNSIPLCLQLVELLHMCNNTHFQLFRIDMFAGILSLYPEVCAVWCTCNLKPGDDKRLSPLLPHTHQIPFGSLILTFCRLLKTTLLLFLLLTLSFSHYSQLSPFLNSLLTRTLSAPIQVLCRSFAFLCIFVALLIYIYLSSVPL